jgi:hypothetical protein
MKNLVFLVSYFIIYFVGYTQVIKDIDKITPFHEDLAAIRKNNQWAFINIDGEKVIGFRNDLVSTTDEHFLDKNGITTIAYPLFKDERCLIKKNIDGVNYYGYIDKSGKEIISAQYLNATNFNNGYAIVIKFAKNIVGNNDVLGKQIVSYKLEEYIIDTSGNLIKYLDNARNSIPSKIKNKIPPSFYSKFIGPHLIAIKTKDQKWNIYEF